ncbi:hypothetical protein CspeluHIS016_0501220 [Cutaneotrichosporon spelunceum]|uniref:N-acetyltransferase domain-containing protein n=1 Tax=Cutaneotrichosporon spelunceum TaxID=1672016 RepID=A0AAD3TX28_9TREE|nr:hypothetical protein CspeluHIS016_0501220 [Cutaneotrichosporon spelunceum]
MSPDVGSRRTQPGITIRPRLPTDMPALCDLLARQQPVSQYPIKWPLSIPVPDFIQRPGESASFVAEHQGQILGHVAVRHGLGGPRNEAELTTRWAAGHECAESDVRVISVLFIDPEWAGRGVGSLLLRVATDAARDGGGRPCLDVVVDSKGPLAFYRRFGWVVVGEWRAPWAREGVAVYLMILPSDDEVVRHRGTRNGGMYLAATLGTASVLLDWEHHRTKDSDEVKVIAALFPKDDLMVTVHLLLVTGQQTTLNPVLETEPLVGS